MITLASQVTISELKKNGVRKYEITKAVFALKLRNTAFLTFLIFVEKFFPVIARTSCAYPISEGVRKWNIYEK
jgi:hypothetical protein